MTHLNEPGPAPAGDAALVAGSLAGDPQAFRQIVARYQTLVCSLTYSGTGNLSQSEDLAQETFIAAWKQLVNLREPHKLRSWLCTIARNLTCVALRKQGREPIHAAEPLAVVEELPSRELLPSERAITREEEAVLWLSLERLPEIYREPLVLFYRGQQSIEAVAQNLELSEDAVKQRLSRGRKLLHEQVVAFVEGALEKTSPGMAFTLGVIAVLPLAENSVKAATVGAVLAKGGPAARGIISAGLLGGFLALLGGAWVSLRAHAGDSKSPRERQFILQTFGLRIFLVLASFAGFFAAAQSAFFRVPLHFDYLVAAFFFYFCFDAVFLSAWQNRRQQQIQIEDNTYVDAEWRISGKSACASRGQGLNLFRRSAFGIISGAMVGVLIGSVGPMVAAPQAWQQQKQHWGNKVLVMTSLAGAGLALLLVFSRARRQNRPHFRQLQWSPRFFVSAIIMGSCTLWFFDYRQYVAHTAGNAFNQASADEILVFNLVVVLAYAAFIIGLRAWKRKNIRAYSFRA